MHIFPLCSVLLSQRPSETGQASAALEEHLHGMLEAGRAAWPGVTVEPVDFIRHLARHLRDGSAAMPTVDHPTDLYLACALVHRVKGAPEAFERAFLSQVPTFLRPTTKDAAIVDEVCQQLRARLLVSADGQEARIAKYSGRAPLRQWLRIVATRTAINLLKQGGRRRETDQDFMELAAPMRGPEKQYDRDRFVPAMQEAIRDASRFLTSEERVLLRLHYGRGLTTGEVAAATGSTQPTVSRKLKLARKTLQEEVQRLLKERLLLTTAEFDSLTVEVRSQLEISLRTLLGGSSAS